MTNYSLPILVLLVLSSAPGQPDVISHNTVKTWAHKLGFELSQLGKYVTNVEKFHDSYKSAKLVPHVGKDLVRDIAKSIKSMMESKISAIKRIMDIAETSALSSKDADPSSDYNFINAKSNISRLLTRSEHFHSNVCMNMSSVHVPTNVYDRSSEVIRAIKWSEELDQTFINNFEHDPSLSWQYFGSATGFMRQYPGTMWDPDNVDLFDCRTRGWYIEAATSPKDMLILVDTSGSMMGMRKEIARHVVNNILDTLGNNDYVNIITFSNVTQEVVPCFNDTLVQANLANVRELKDAIADLQTEQIANFSMVLNHAFELLEQFREEREGAMCNQAIMLVTDGVPFNFKEIFQRYNWRESPDEPDKADMPVRVFTYLIGREVADVREVKWMACANRGYYVHLSTFAEVREQVLNYVPVMARPLVLGKTDHPTIWTPVYADITDPKMTDYLWERRESKEQKQRIFLYRKDRKAFLNSDQRDRRFVHKPKKHNDQHDGLQEYKLMTSVSVPVYDRRENANITEQVLVKEAYWVTETRETRIADLLGVAGTDVPVQEIQKLMMPHKLGVNGYAFIVTNNGYILTHPDLRPVFQGILKPSYNSVDMAEVELMDVGRGPREFEETILSLRDDVINQTSGNVALNTKYHYDDMKRVGRVKRKYDYKGIENTPFTVVVSLPEHDNHSGFRVQAEEEIHRYHVSGKSVTDYFAGTNWRVHPDWDYCKYHYEADHRFNSSEKLLLHFLERTRQPGWKWIDSRQRSQPPEHSASNSSNSEHTNPPPDRNSYFCDRSLLLSLVYDAKVTEWFANINTTREEKGPLARLMNLLPRKEFQQRFGFTLAFMATHSGLTRWQDFTVDEEDAPDDHHFSKLYPHAIDEIWYKRAVEHNYQQPDSFVFSVPLDPEETDNTTLVTASRAIFISDEKGKAPVAVVGFQFQHTALQGLFQNITFNCEKLGNCHKDCSDDSLACYLVDNNGYIVVAENESDAGKFLGTVRGPIMSSMVEEGIFDKVRIFDYQAVCFKRTQTTSDACIISTPWRSIQRAISWILGQAFWAWAKMGLWDSESAHTYAYPNEEEAIHEDYPDNGDKSADSGKGGGDKEFLKNVAINKTKPQPCDKEMYLYLLRNGSTRDYDVDFDSANGCGRPYVVQPVDFSNLLLLVVYANCPGTEHPRLTVEPDEIVYPNASLACQKVLNELRRRRPQSCIRSHPRESEIKDRCGLASSFEPNFKLLVASLIGLARAFSRTTRD